jgi:hypothetical protein
MKQIVLHIGMPKTGTSALQVFLARNHAALKEHATDYFQIGEFNLGLKGSISSGNGSFLARTLLHPNAPARIPDGERHQAEFHAALEKSTAEVGIVSSELFIDATREQLEKLLASIRDRGITVKAFYYIRRHDQFLASAYMQQVKRHGYTDHPEAYVRTAYRSTPFLKYHSFYRYLADIFGARNIICRIYDDAIREEHGLFADFLSALGIDDAGFATDIPDINTSLSPKEVAIMLMVNRYRPRMQFSDLVVENAVTSGAMKAGVEHRLLPRRLVEEIEEFFRNENALLAQEYFGRPTLFEAPSVNGPTDPIATASLSFEDLITFFGGLVVRYDQRMVELDQRVTEMGKVLRALRAELHAAPPGKS